MRILIIRHGDPDFETDGLTETGKKEAELLSQKLEGENINEVYCSVLGRARLTAEPTLRKKGLTAAYCEWLREFNYVDLPNPEYGSEDVRWDMLPEYMNKFPELYEKDGWYKSELIKGSDVYESYKAVCDSFDKVLAKNGYVRDGNCYKVICPNHNTIAFFCHYGLSGVLLSHIMNCSPYSIWQNALLPPSSVTTVYTEERREGIASLRVCGIGDISHLYANGENASFSGRFCETFTDDTRHD